MIAVVKMSFGGTRFHSYLLVDPVFSADGIHAKYATKPKRVSKKRIEDIRNMKVGGLFPFVSNGQHDIFHIVEYKVLP